ncbi:hypothetical protein ACJJTC_002834 [Scirpophaga incertulas]
MATGKKKDFATVYSWWGGGRTVSSYGTNETPDEQVVFLPALLPREAQLSADKQHDEVPLPYSFSAFGRSFNLKLVPNRRLVSRHFRVWSESGQEPRLSAAEASCHFLHAGPDAVVALSACRDHALHGLIVIDNSTYEVRPLPVGSGRSENVDGLTAHLIRRAPPPPPPFDDALPLRPRVRRPRVSLGGPYMKTPPSSYTIEIALFLDAAGYKLFHPFLNYNEADLRDMLLAYINGVQALYQHPSLGTRIQLSLVRLTLLRAQPPTLPAHAERGHLLDAFCAYQRSLNVDDDSDPEHWDMALLLSGLDFYSDEGGRRNGVTMGLAPVGGVCLPAHACVVAELGATDTGGRPYPSTGFTSAYILAHEIGHNLGMHHDGTGNNCARDGYIMSPSRGTSGEATWSPCSARIVADLQWATCLFDGGDEFDTPDELRHEKFGLAPGAVWGAKRQCEVLLRDVDAAPVDRKCQRRPALPGTPCGNGMWCQGGECVPTDSASTTEAVLKPTSGSPGQLTGGEATSGGDGPWNKWRESSCRSSCTLRSRGARERRRACPKSSSCDSTSYDVVLCDDTKVCGKKNRISAGELAGRKCAEYAALLPVLDARGGGLQAPHDPTRMWMGCAVFCRRVSGGGFYAPRVELNAVGLDPYFPDGTWCHHDGAQDYYCLQHHCLPENFKMSAQWHVWELPSEDIGEAFNARTNSDEDNTAEQAMNEYLSLDDDGVPIIRSAFPPPLPDEAEKNWEVVDYIGITSRYKDTKK